MSVLFWMIWRRIYGEGKVKKYFNRTLQTLLAVAVLCCQLQPLHWAVAVAVATWVIIEYWSRSVGEIIDAGLNNQQTAESYGRWFRVPLDWVYERLGLEKYVGFYDFWYSSIRNFIGALPLICLSPVAVALVPCQYFIYLGCHKLYQRYPNMYYWPLTLDDPKNLAEIIHGALFGLVVG